MIKSSLKQCSLGIHTSGGHAMKRQLMSQGRRLYGSIQTARGALGRFGGRAGQSVRPAFFFGFAVIAGLGLIAAGPVERVGEAEAAELERVVVASVADDLVSTAWRKRALERERERNVPEFAAAFSIPSELAEKIYVAAQTHEIEPEVAFGLVRAESSFRRGGFHAASAIDGAVDRAGHDAGGAVRPGGEPGRGVPVPALPEGQVRGERGPGADGVQPGSGPGGP
jgi:hypothetical protein